MLKNIKRNIATLFLTTIIGANSLNSYEEEITWTNHTNENMMESTNEGNDLIEDATATIDDVTLLTGDEINPDENLTTPIVASAFSAGMVGLILFKSKIKKKIYKKIEKSQNKH